MGSVAEQITSCKSSISLRAATNFFSNFFLILAIFFSIESCAPEIVCCKSFSISMLSLAIRSFWAFFLDSSFRRAFALRSLSLACAASCSCCCRSVGNTNSGILCSAGISILRLCPTSYNPPHKTIKQIVNSLIGGARGKINKNNSYTHMETHKTPCSAIASIAWPVRRVVSSRSPPHFASP